MLRGIGISKNFGGLPALDNVDFEVGQGEIVGLIGPNGSGKTTLFNIISGLIRADSGEMEFSGSRITSTSPHIIAKMGIGRTFQIVRPLMDQSLLSNTVTAVLYGREGISDPDSATQRALEILEFCGLKHKADSYPGELALEDCKRLEVARALGLKPLILLLDEVYAGLNSSEIMGAIELTLRIRDQWGVTIFMIEHVMKAIMGACDRVIALHHGVKIADGPPRETANHPEVVRAYLGAGYASN